MASLRPRADQAASRRLELLTAELAAARPAPPPAEDDPWLEGHTRIRPLRAVPDPTPEPAPEPPPAPLVPVPGRHAARRRRESPRLAPEALRGRISLGPSQLLVIALLVAIGLAVTAWWVVRGDPERLEAPGPLSSSAAPLADATAASSSPDAPVAAGASAGAGGTGDGAGDAAGDGVADGAASVTVDVTGKVRKRGIVVLDAGARVVDAVEAAGGARSGVDLSSLNLARVLVDGEQVVVGRPTSAPVVAPPSGGPGGVLVDLNTATQAELESLPEVGPVTAEAILSWRSEHGGFTAVDELLEVDGIGDATLAQLAPHVTV
ncbi:helix-hairpin-helix domain-containing protein [Nocardioides sp. YIM 152315]|uniref:helix-hairpin-helix domain-containing protein n=1 Tax=Nocardioides sp. YIM 152315 TaxID=3031760 RepID=UPI0023DA0FF1|nr:helix-hairpin-helix domain-containing protein [Nocardioides sp. YIM 152315]MDF1602078.1 helix-hairpin-helix domain-containing protein [Nocardioides sp. YIM 152315]